MTIDESNDNNYIVIKPRWFTHLGYHAALANIYNYTTLYYSEHQSRFLGFKFSPKMRAVVGARAFLHFYRGQTLKIMPGAGREALLNP